MTLEEFRENKRKDVYIKRKKGRNQTIEEITDNGGKTNLKLDGAKGIMTRNKSASEVYPQDFVKGKLNSGREHLRSLGCNNNQRVKNSGEIGHR
jgi:hypothetical protein